MMPMRGRCELLPYQPPPPPLCLIICLYIMPRHELIVLGEECASRRVRSSKLYNWIAANRPICTRVHHSQGFKLFNLRAVREPTAGCTRQFANPSKCPTKNLH